MGATKEIAEFICHTRYSNFDLPLVKHTKDLCLSGLGMTLGGVNMHTSQAVISYVRECGAPPEAGVIGAGFRTSAEYAALANGTSSHATELEDDSFPEAMYMVGIFPTAFALGEKLRLSGKEVIEAIIIGYQVASRLALPCVPAMSRGFLSACVFGSLGASATAAKLLKLGVHETTMALSLAASQSSGLIRQTGTGAHLYESGVCGRNGITAAMLAKHGLTGQPDIIEGRAGLCDAVANVPEPDLQLGEFRIRDVGIKKYPCCFLEMHIIDTFLELIKEHSISADDVESIQVDIYPGFMRAVRYQHPTNEDDARFSLPHSIAACFLDDKVYLDSYTDVKARDPRFQAFREKVKMVVHPEWDAPGVSGPEVPIAIRCKDGTEYKGVCPRAAAPIVLSDEEVRDKYMTCALRILSRKQAEEVAKVVLALDELDDVSKLMQILTFPSGG